MDHRSKQTIRQQLSGKDNETHGCLRSSFMDSVERSTFPSFRFSAAIFITAGSTKVSYTMVFRSTIFSWRADFASGEITMGVSVQRFSVWWFSSRATFRVLDV
jgi:hypothetical protein